MTPQAQIRPLITPKVKLILVFAQEMEYIHQRITYGFYWRVITSRSSFKFLLEFFFFFSVLATILAYATIFVLLSFHRAESSK
jgi:hypothetical protein